MSFEFEILVSMFVAPPGLFFATIRIVALVKMTAIFYWLPHSISLFGY
jgi:hypothetical protein